MVLEVVDQITLNTRIGTSVIQLLLGDITDLSVDKKVDIVFTSAFPGDYGSGIKTTLFYSLKTKLGISANNLAKNKDLDLRKNFSCWLSKPLPPDKPFRRLACFEVLRTQNINEQISMMFRAIMPIFNGKESSIITPPLATGCQGVPVEDMMNVMVNTACNWIKAGLPLTCMKLVLFCKDIERARTFQYDEAIKLFKGLKAYWEKKEKEVENESYDVTLCFHDQDKELMSKIQSTFLKVDKSLKIHSDIFIKNDNDSWQNETFEVLANSKRIVIVLTPAYVTDKWCLDQFNMSLCCNRLKGDEVVIPFNMETVETLPSFMNLVQYKECRVRNSGENAEDRLTDACAEVIKAIKNSNVVTSAQFESPSVIEKEKQAPVYDVFVSYSHRTPELAKITFDILKEKYPKLNVFFDRSELKSGNIWQQALYDAVDQTYSMIAFLSDPYISSSVCQEEFNIALARMKAEDNFLLVPVCLPELSEVSASHVPISPVRIFSSDEIEGLVNKFMPSVEKIISGEEEKVELDVTSVRNIQIHNRFQDFKKKFTFDKTMKRIVPLVETNGASRNIKSTITFAYGSDGMKLAASLSEVIRQEFPNITAKLLSYTQTETRKEIDSADMVVIFVSDEFLWSQHHVEELHIALCRQRTIKDSTVVYLVEVDHQAPIPFYTHILPYNVSMDDPMWQKYATSFDYEIQRYAVNTPGMEGTYNCSAAEHLALMKMKFDIVELLSQRGQGSSLLTNLVNIVKTELINEGKKDRKLAVSELPTVASFEPYGKLNTSELLAEDNHKELEASTTYNTEMIQEVNISPEERAQMTFKNRPQDPADQIIREMNKFYINKQSSEACKNEPEEPQETQEKNESKANQNCLVRSEEKIPKTNSHKEEKESNQTAEGVETRNGDCNTGSQKKGSRSCILS